MHLTRKRPCAVPCAVALCLLLAACGGGGGGGSSGSGLTPFPTEITDTLPPGTRIDVSSKNLFQMGSGDMWHYTKLDAGGNPIGVTVTRQVTAGPDQAGHVSISDDDGGFSVATYLVSADGLVDESFFGLNAPQSARTIMGAIFEYATPLYPQGTERKLVRSGPWGADLDGDGNAESFRFEYTQVFLGFETAQLSSFVTLNDVAHFHNVVKLTLRPTAVGYTDYSVTGTEDAWFSPGLGMVKAQRTIVDSDGFTLDPPHTLLFRQGSVAGVNWNVTVPPTPQLDGSFIDVALVHNALVYDSLRNVYYASVPGSVVGKGNSIATIDPVTGQVSYSAPVGSEPNALAIAADASVLYVGLDGSGDVVRLALPAMTQQGTVHLPADVFGQPRVLAIAVSPADPSVAAISMGRPLGVGLLRDMVLQTNRAGVSSYYGKNLLAFDAAGTAVYALDNETDRTLNRFVVLADGLADGSTVPQSTSFYTRALSIVNNRVIAAGSLYDAPALNALGAISGAPECIPRRADALLMCFTIEDLSGQARILLADSSTFVIGSSLLFALSEPFNSARHLVEGPTGQVAISYVETKIRLFSSPLLLTPPTPPVAAWPVTYFLTADGQGLDVGIVHKAIVYDATRNVYYASVPGSVIGSGNSIARIDPATGQVTHSAPIGSEPNALALSADASALYVGLDGSGEVVRLSLPSMAEQSRTRLPVPYGKSLALAIAASPTDPGAAAVQMSNQLGTALLRDMVMQPKQTQTYRTNNLLAFDTGGTTLYGLDTDFGQVRIIQVLVDGLADQQTVATSVMGAQALSFANNRVIVGRALFDTPAFTQAGFISGAADCVPQRAGTLLLCLAVQDFSTGRVRILVADSGTFVIGASLLAATSEPSPTTRRLVQGPAGQVAISYSYFSIILPDFSIIPPFLRLFTSAQLP
jgi:hypothetical protein